MSRSSSCPRSSCPIVGTLDVLGDKWTLVVVRDLMFRGFRQYREFLQAGEGIATNVLAERLDRLLKAGLITRRTKPEDRKQQIYLLTETGMTLAPVLIEIILWGLEHRPDTMAPPALVKRMRKDRTALIAELNHTWKQEFSALPPEAE